MHKFMWGLSSIKIKTSGSETRGKDNLTRLLSKKENAILQLNWDLSEQSCVEMTVCSWSDMTGGKGSHCEASPLTNRWSKSRPQAQKLARRTAGCAVHSLLNHLVGHHHHHILYNCYPLNIKIDCKTIALLLGEGSFNSLNIYYSTPISGSF